MLASISNAATQEPWRHWRRVHVGPLDKAGTVLATHGSYAWVLVDGADYPSTYHFVTLSAPAPSPEEKP